MIDDSNYSHVGLVVGYHILGTAARLEERIRTQFEFLWSKKQKERKENRRSTAHSNDGTKHEF